MRDPLTGKDDLTGYGDQWNGVMSAESAFQHTMSPEMLRDWFAGQAIGAAILHYTGGPIVPKTVASKAYSIADAMLEARKK
jgi:hypothetical protein